MDLALIPAALKSVEAAFSLIRGLLETKVDAEWAGKLVDLREHLFKAQDSLFEAKAVQATLVEQIRTLEKEIVEMKKWEADKQRYALTDQLPGVFAYAIKESVRGADPVHWICEACYQGGRKSVLHKIRHPENRAFNALKCFHCTFLVELPSSSFGFKSI